MMRKIIGAAILTGAAVAVTAAVKIVMDRKESEDGDTDEEVHFISIEDDEEPGEDVANIENMSSGEEEPEKEVSAEVQEICSLYPYLDASFIEEQLNRNDEFNRQYPEDTLITISHKAAFASKEIAEQYRGIAEANGYIFEPISDTENVVTRRLFMENGAILSDIYNVANQIACLKGGYEGYSISA